MNELRKFGVLAIYLHASVLLIRLWMRLIEEEMNDWSNESDYY
jgi:hypothetical protein